MLESTPSMRVKSSLGPIPPSSTFIGAPEPVETETRGMPANSGWGAAAGGGAAAGAGAAACGAGAGAAAGRGADGGGSLTGSTLTVVGGTTSWDGAAAAGAAATGALGCPLKARSNRAPSGAGREATSIFGCDAFAAGAMPAGVTDPVGAPARTGGP